ncbi:MAG: ABC transporter permease [Verrucomicrobia bacterium]|nr:ABC transporter permease [Verrucomicrobiota bacterium]
MSDVLGQPVLRRRRMDVFRVLAALAGLVVIAYIVLLVVVDTTLLGPNTLGELLSTERTLRSILLSLAVALVASAMAMVVGIPAAYALSRLRLPGRAVFDTLVDVPIALSPIALGVILLAMFSTGPGRFVEDNAVAFSYALPGILLAQLTVVCALTIRLLKTAFDDVSPRLETIARTLGSTRWRAFRRVTLPLARRGVFAAFVISFARAFGEFGATTMIAGVAPGPRETLPAGIYLKFMTLEVSHAAGLIVLGMLVAFVVILVLRMATSADLKREIW